MRHRVYGRHLGRDKNQRTALFRGLIRSLILHEHIETTQVKAKAIRGQVDRLIAKSKQDSVSGRRIVNATLPQAEVSKKLIEEIAPRYKDRTSGFTEMIRLGQRLGDGAMMVRISLAQASKNPESKKAAPKVEENLDIEKPEERTKAQRNRKTARKEESK